MRIYSNSFPILTLQQCILVTLTSLTLTGLRTLSGMSSISSQFCNFTFDAGLCQLVNGLTHVHSNTLDLLLTNFEENIHSLLVHSQQQLLSSVHYGITFKLASSQPPRKLPTYYTFNYSKGDYTGLSNYLLDIDFTSCLQSHDVRGIWCTIEQFIVNAMKLFIPITKMYSHQHPHGLHLRLDIDSNVCVLFVVNLNITPLII